MLNTRIQKFRSIGRGAIISGRNRLSYSSYYVLPFAAAVGLDFAAKFIDPLMMNPPTNWF